jgi:hypothetical protein
MKEEITELLETRWRDIELKALTQKLRAEAKIEIIDATLRSLNPD